MSNITNLNRDYLIKINVKEATIDAPKMTFWNTDKKTSNMFIQLVINMSENELIKNYVTIENATDYKITLNVIKPKTNQYRTFEAKLLNEEKALFEIDLTSEFIDQVGNYNFEFEVSSKVDSNDESITTSSSAYEVKGSILTNLNQEISSSPDLPILKQLIEQVKQLQGGDLTDYQKKSDAVQKTTVEDGKLYLTKSDGTKLDDGTALPTGSGTSIDDSNTVTDKTWSSSKIDSQFKDIANLFTTEQTETTFIIKCGNKVIATIPINGTLSENEILTTWKANFKSNYVDKYIADYGLVIDNEAKTESEITDWLLNKDNCKYRGKLQKSGVDLVDKNGEKFEIRGVGTHHLLQYSNLHTKACLESLKYFGVNCIRLSVYLEDYNFASSDDELAYGYISKPEEHKTHMDNIIADCIDLGLYVIIDWHVLGYGTNGQKPVASESLHEIEGKEFFTYFANKYANCDNIMYEIANEPYTLSSTQCLNFVKNVRNIIKNKVNNPIMIMNNGNDGVSGMYNTLKNEGITDIFISAHHYGSNPSSTYQTYIDSGIPMFISEWGNSSSSGDGAGNDTNATNFLEWCHNKKVPHCIWKYTDQTMTTSLLKNLGSINNSHYVNGFKEDDLSDNGKLNFNKFKEYAFNYIPDSNLVDYALVGMSIETDGTYKFSPSGVKNFGYANVPVIKGKQYKLNVYGKHNRFKCIFSETSLSSGETGTVVIDDDSLNEYTYIANANGYISVYLTTQHDVQTPTMCSVESDYEDSTTYTITNNLTNCSNSNSVIRIEKNSSYTGTITANNRYTLIGATVTITMGGVDITSTVYSEGNINIESVIGDVVITISAKVNSTSFSEQDNVKILDLSSTALLNSKYNTSGEQETSTGSVISTTSINVKPSTTYTVSVPNNSLKDIVICEFNDNNGLIKRTPFIDSKFANFTTESTTSYVKLMINVKTSTSFSTNILKYVEITKGTVDYNYSTIGAAITADGIVKHNYGDVSNLAYMNIPVLSGSYYNIAVNGEHDRFRVAFTSNLCSKSSGGNKDVTTQANIIIDDSSLNNYTYYCEDDGYISVYVTTNVTTQETIITI